MEPRLQYLLIADVKGLLNDTKMADKKAGKVASSCSVVTRYCLSLFGPNLLQKIFVRVVVSLKAF